MMIKNKQISFRHGAMLTREMLEEMYDYPRDYLELKYDGYSDGVICGLDLTENAQLEVCLQKGIIKFDGELFFLLEEVNLTRLVKESGLKDGQHYCIYLCPQTKMPGNTDISEHRLQIEVEKTMDKKVFVIGRGCYDSGLLRLPVCQADDLSRLYSSAYFSVLELPYALPNEATFHPYIFQQLLSVLLNKKAKGLLDYMLITGIQKDGIIPLATLRLYLQECGENGEGAEPKVLLKKLAECIKKYTSKVMVSGAAAEETTVNSIENKAKRGTRLL